MNAARSISSRSFKTFMGRTCFLLALVCFWYAPVIIGVAYIMGDVPDYLQHRWKFHATFAPYFFSSLLAAYASVVFSILAACLSPRPSRFLLIVLCLGAVISHGQWEHHLRRKGRPDNTARSQYGVTFDRDTNGGGVDRTRPGRNGDWRNL